MPIGNFFLEVRELEVRESYFAVRGEYHIFSKRSIITFDAT